MAAKTNAASTAEKWKRGMQGAGTAIKEGVMAVKESPTAKAARAKDKMLAGVQRCIDDGSYEEGCNSVSLAEWQRLTLDKGLSRVSGGATDAASKMQDFYSQLLPFTAQVSADVQAMPNNNDAEADARLMAAVNKMRQFRFRKKRA